MTGWGPMRVLTGVVVWWCMVVSPCAAAVGEVPAFEGVFRFGWSGFEAARASAVVSYEGDEVRVRAEGGTSGAVRWLYALDAVFEARVRRDGFWTVWSRQVEEYPHRVLTTAIEEREGALWTSRWTDEEGRVFEGWKRVPVEGARGLFAAMCEVRRRVEPDGAPVRVLVFPGVSPFLVEARAVGVERLRTPNGDVEALRLDLEIRRVDVKRGNALRPHGKFRSGSVWLTNDDDRLPLRAEVDLFIGYVFGEAVEITKTGGGG
jgi:hypothetical protein